MKPDLKCQKDNNKATGSYSIMNKEADLSNRELYRNEKCIIGHIPYKIEVKLNTNNDVKKTI